MRSVWSANVLRRLRQKLDIGSLLLLAAAMFAVSALSGSMRSGGLLRFVLNRNDDVSKYEQRLAGLRETLPRRGAVGYLTDVASGEVMAKAKAMKSYYLTQYAVAPVVVVNSAEEDLLIGNFHTQRAYRRAISDPKLRVVKDLGNGVVLLRRESE